MADEPATARDSESISLHKPAELKSTRAVVVIDVRSAEEFATGHVTGSVNVPLDRLMNGDASQFKHTEMVTVCARGGARSHDAAKHLRSVGIEARPLCGGARAWLESQDAVESVHPNDLQTFLPSRYQVCHARK